MAIASHSRSTSGSPKTCSAQPSFGYAAIVQLTPRAFWILSACSIRVIGRVLPTRPWSRSARSSGSASPAIEATAAPSDASARSTSQTGEWVRESSGASSIRAWLTCGSL